VVGLAALVALWLLKMEFLKQGSHSTDKKSVGKYFRDSIFNTYGAARVAGFAADE